MGIWKDRYFKAEFSWRSLFSAALLSAYAYVFFEWLFIVTKPSYLTTAPLLEKIRIGVFTASLFSIAVLLALLPLAALSAFVRGTGARRLLLSLGALVPAGVLACLALLLFDNFTYTVFKFGISTSVEAARATYLFLFLGLLAAIYLSLEKDISGYERAAGKNQRRVFPGLLVLLLAGLLLSYGGRDAAADAGPTLVRRDSMPNIILVTADGLNAANTSIYPGYERETTPILAGLAQHSLLAENAFNNSGNTMGSYVSIFTSKYPTETRTLYPPEILRGEDAYQHLPNILKNLDYYNIQYAHSHYVDAFTQNMLSGFDWANGKTARVEKYEARLNRYLKTNYSYFIYEVFSRISDRLRHITFLKTMDNNQALVNGEGTKYPDMVKVERILEAVRVSDRPVFAHLHWMGTHGGKYYPMQRVYSKGKDLETQMHYDRDLYDDTIMDFDSGIGAIIDGLKAMGAWDNTILIVSADHGQHFVTTNRIPLLIHFPGDQFQRRISGSVQSMDIAPTLLEYLQIPKPNWMRGTSFLTTDPSPRPIIGVRFKNEEKASDGRLHPETIKPPFYQYNFISVVYCGSWYEMDLENYRWAKGRVAGYIGACPGSAEVSDEDAFAWMRDRLAQDGFDTTSLSTFNPVASTSP